MHEISIALLANKKRSKRLIYKRKNMEELFKAIEENNIGTVKLLLE
jgi:hypothetical protein